MPLERAERFRVHRVLAEVAAGTWPATPPATFTDELRQVVEAALAPAVEALPTEALPLRAPKRRMTDVLACERAALAAIGSVPPVEATAPGQFVDRLVQGHVLGFGCGGGDPVRFGRDAFDAEGADELLAWLDALDDTARASLHERLVAVEKALVDGWGPIEDAWWPRCEQPVTVPLLGGRVLASGRFDVALGGPHTGRRGVILEVKAGSAARQQRSDLHWYALLAAWSWGEAPALVATWSAQDDSLSVEPVGEGMLEVAARRAVHAIGRLAHLAAGGEPQIRASDRCRWCPVLHDCDEGLDQLRRTPQDDLDTMAWSGAGEEDGDAF